jgi:hypothetical protein
MKKGIVCLILLTLLALLVLSGGCGESKNGDENGADGNGRVDDNVTQTDYDVGLVEGYGDGYDQGYLDGKEGDYDPMPELDGDWNDDYAIGYEEGFLDGYDDGYNDAVEESGGQEEEMAEVEAAMLAFVEQNSVPGLEFEIVNIIINGNEAAGRAVCTSETLESPYVIMKKGPSGWYGVEFGTGIEPPDWYDY